MGATPLVVIGLDGASRQLVETLLEDADLPALRKLYEEGQYTDLDTVFPPHTAPAWTSFATGKNPGKHGVYEWICVKDGNVVADRSRVDGQTFYDILQENGKRVGIVNLPLSHPPSIDGDIVTGFDTKGEEFVFPAGLRDEVDFSDYKLFLTSYEKLKDLTDNLLAFTRSQVAVVKEMYTQKEYDFFFYLFSATDWLQHSHLDAVLEREPRETYEACLELFTEIDQFLGWMMEEIDENGGNLIVMSDHGFKQYDGAFYVNTWLKNQGWLESTPNPDSQIFWGSDNKIISLLNKSSLLKTLALKLLPYFQFAIPSNIYVRLESNLANNIEMETTQAFCPRSELSAIYINDSRFNGVVDDAEREALRDEIMDRLAETPVTPVPKEDVYHGGNTRYAPDILLRQDKYKVQRSILHTVTQQLPIFNHSETGIFIRYGADVEDPAVSVMDMVDVAPTILDFFDITPPDDMDGEPIT